MSAPVDVLAQLSTTYCPVWCLEAVAELIEAGVELQAAMDENETAASKFDKSSADRFHKADARHRAAVSRVTGGAS